MKQSKRDLLPGGRQPLNKQEIFAAIEQFEQAGNISVKEFAAAFQVPEATFYNRRKQYRAKAMPQATPAGFIPVTTAINQLQDEFYENDSEIETGAREAIGETVDRIIKFFNIDIDIEEAIRERDW